MASSFTCSIFRFLFFIHKFSLLAELTKKLKRWSLNIYHSKTLAQFLQTSCFRFQQKPTFRPKVALTGGEGERGRRPEEKMSGAQKL